MHCKVPYIDQMPKWPTGCESVSTVMALQYLGADITVDGFIDYLPQKALEAGDGEVIGASPREYFIGSPYDGDSFGCYADVIVRTVNRLAADRNWKLRAEDVSEFSTEDLMERFVRRGIPVIYWATIDLKPSRIGPTWRIGGGGTFTWRSNEHCMLLVGEEGDCYRFNDPWNGHGVIDHPKALTEQRHAEMYSMAVVIRREP